MTIEELRESLRDPDAIRRDPFGILRSISSLAVLGRPEDAIELVLRALDKRDAFNGHGQILNSLVRQVGLYPYLETDSLSTGDLIAYEYHRPFALDNEIVFHQVQAKVYRELLSGQNVILSAPTSFGKSLIIDALIASGRYSNIVVVVPTIALIDETRRRLARFSESFRIITHVSQRLGHKNVLVLTQERVIDHAGLPQIDLFVVDEFYKLSPGLDKERSTLLNHAFYKLFKTGAQFYLLGPDIHDLPPELPDRLECHFIRTDYATVVSETTRVRTRDEREELVRLCRTLPDSSLIFCSSPKRVREVAKWLLEGGVDGHPRQVDVAVDWMGREYHQEWLAAKALSRGIAMHHGRMPRALSQYMVRAFNEDRARLLICTSTLIEGVNTKAKNVIVFDNKIARRKYDYFTFNNIRGRSGRMFQHFIGHVFLFHEPPHKELPFVDFPVWTQPEEVPKSLLVQLDDADLAERSRERLSSLMSQDALDIGVIRENSGVDPDQQVALASEIRRAPDRYWRDLHWSGFPTYEQLKFACTLIWRLRATNQGRAGVLSAAQLAFKINQLRMTPEIPALISAELGKAQDPDEAVESVLEFIRQWATFEFPRLLVALHRIQESVFSTLGMEPGNFTAFAARVENLFMRPPLAALDEYGIPLQTAQRLEQALNPDGDLDELLARLKTFDLSALGLHPFERELIEDARKYF